MATIRRPGTLPFCLRSSMKCQKPSPWTSSCSRREMNLPSRSRTAAIADRLAGGMMNQDGVLFLRCNPHSAPRTVLLEMDFIQGPQINVVSCCQCAQSFFARVVELGPDDPPPGGVCATEIPTVGTGADIDGFPTVFGTFARSKPTRFCRPRGWPPDRTVGAIVATRRLPVPIDGHSAERAGLNARLRPGRRGRCARIGSPSIPRCEDHHPKGGPLRDNSYLGRPTGRRASDDRSAIDRNGESRLVLPESFVRHRIWRVLSYSAMKAHPATMRN